MSLTFITYHSHNAKPDEAWIAYVILPDGSNWGVRFTGATEADATLRARTLYEREKSRMSAMNYGDYGKVVDNNEPVKPSGWPMPSVGKGAVFAGKVWMKNFVTNERARVDPSQLAEYEAKGYVKAGPRS